MMNENDWKFIAAWSIFCLYVEEQLLVHNVTFSLWHLHISLLQLTHSSLPLFHNLSTNTSCIILFMVLFIKLNIENLFCSFTASLFHAVTWLVGRQQSCWVQVYSLSKQRQVGFLVLFTWLTGWIKIFDLISFVTCIHRFCNDCWTDVWYLNSFC